MKTRFLQKCVKSAYEYATKGDYSSAYNVAKKCHPKEQQFLTSFRNQAFSQLGPNDGASVVINFAAYRGLQKGLKKVGGINGIVESASESSNQFFAHLSDDVSKRVISELPQTTLGWIKNDVKKSWVDLKYDVNETLRGLKSTIRTAKSWIQKKLPIKSSSNVKTALKSKSKAINITKSVPEELKPLFANLEGKTGQEFVDAGYENLIKYMKLEGAAPKSIALTMSDGLWSVTGGFSPIKNTIEFSKGFLDKLSPKDQMKLLSHELTHFKQYSSMLRTEGIGVEAYARVIAENDVRQSLNSSSFSFMFKSQYNAALKNGKGEEFIQKAIDAQTKSYIPEIEKNFADVLKMPKISANSPEGKKAYEYLEAQKNYEGLDVLGLGSDAYKNNPLEVEAYGFGDKMGEIFGKYFS